MDTPFRDFENRIIDLEEEIADLIIERDDFKKLCDCLARDLLKYKFLILKLRSLQRDGIHSEAILPKCYMSDLYNLAKVSIV